jgi:hypothetical protein
MKYVVAALTIAIAIWAAFGPPSEPARRKSTPEQGMPTTTTRRFRRRSWCAMNDLTSEIGLVKRQLRDVLAVASNVDHRTRKLVEPSAIHRSGGLVARLAAVELLARSQKRLRGDVAKQYFRDDNDLAPLIELKAAMAPAQTTVSGWAAELAGAAVPNFVPSITRRSAWADVLARLPQISLLGAGCCICLVPSA